MVKIGLKPLLILMIAAFGLLALQASGFAMFSSGRDIVNTPKFVPNEIIVKFKPSFSSAASSISSLNTNSETLEKLNQKYGATEIKKIFNGKSEKGIMSAAQQKTEGIYKITISKGSDIIKISQEYGSLPEVEYAEPNFLFEICKTPNDPGYKDQWGLFKISASGGWDAMVGDPDIVIAVVDTGVDYKHPDLSSNIWKNEDEIPNNGIDDDNNGYVDDVMGYDFVSVPSWWVDKREDAGPPDNDPMDVCGHGTHVSGIAASSTNNGIGAAGTTWDCKIMPLRAGYLAYDGGGYLEFVDCAEAIMYAANNGADVINMSWGSTYDSRLMRDVIDYAYSKGCVLVAAAGNVTKYYMGKPFYPAAYPGVIAVAATDSDDEICIWSMDVFSNYGNFVDVTAPGTSIYSTLPNNSYAWYSGTSMATPFVSGLAALIKVKNKNYTNVQIEERIKQSADNIYSKNPDWLKGLLGAGRINAFKALGSINAEIDYPKSGQEVANNLLIKGSANIENFKSYKIEYGIGKVPSSFVQIGLIHTAPVINGILEKLNGEGFSGEYSIRLTVCDTDDNSYSKTVTVDFSKKAEAEIIGDTLAGPNPFSPLSGVSKIFYSLGSTPPAGLKVDVCIFNMTGQMIWKFSNLSNFGDNFVYWDGRTSYGDLVGNGVYPYILIIDDGGKKKVLGRSKIAVLK